MDGNVNVIGAVGVVEIAQAFIAVSRTSKFDSKASPIKEDTEVIDAKNRNCETSDFVLNRIPRRPDHYFEVITRPFHRCYHTTI